MVRELAWFPKQHQFGCTVCDWFFRPDWDYMRRETEAASVGPRFTEILNKYRDQMEREFALHVCRKEEQQ